MHNNLKERYKLKKNTIDEFNKMQPRATIFRLISVNGQDLGIDIAVVDPDNTDIFSFDGKYKIKTETIPNTKASLRNTANKYDYTIKFKDFKKLVYEIYHPYINSISAAHHCDDIFITRHKRELKTIFSFLSFVNNMKIHIK
jgi:hypothetical protein